jgi:hypothetical protein
MLLNLRERKKQEKIGWTTIPYPNNHFFQPSHIWSNLKFLNFFFFGISIWLCYFLRTPLSLSRLLSYSLSILLSLVVLLTYSHTHTDTHTLFLLRPFPAKPSTSDGLRDIPPFTVGGNFLKHLYVTSHEVIIITKQIINHLKAKTCIIDILLRLINCNLFSHDKRPKAD